MYCKYYLGDDEYRNKKGILFLYHVCKYYLKEFSHDHPKNEIEILSYVNFSCEQPVREVLKESLCVLNTDPYWTLKHNWM